MFTPGWSVVPGEVATAVKMSQLGANDDYLLDRVDSSDAPGDVKAHLGSSAPTGWLLCNGAVVSRTTYADLFALVGTTYGAGDGSTTFGLPDFRGYVLAGVNPSDSDLDALGDKFGTKNVTLTEAQIPVHNHSVDPPSTNTSSDSHSHSMSSIVDNLGTSSGNAFDSFPGADLRIVTKNTGSDSHTHSLNIAAFSSGNKGGGGSHNNMQPTAAVNWVVKY